MGLLRYLIFFSVIAIMVCQICSAQISSLSEDEMGEFVAQEGVCDIRLPDTCNTDSEVEETRSIANKQKTIFTDDSMKTQMHVIDQSHIFDADHDKLGQGMTPMPGDNFYYPRY